MSMELSRAQDVDILDVLNTIEKGDVHVLP